MKKLMVLILFAVTTLTAFAQDKYVTRSGYLSFLSETLIENIFGESKEATSFFDKKTGEVVFSVAITSFQFKNKLMQEHFNENYMESGKFPKATFSGKLEDFNKFDITSPTSQTLIVKGKLTVHGVTRDVTSQVIFTFSGTGRIHAESTFKCKPEDFEIKIPSAMGVKIAKELDVVVKADYEKYKQ